MRRSWRILCLFLLVPVVCAADDATPWHHPFYLSGGGWWRQRIRIEVRNEQARPVAGEPVAVPVGTGAGQADLAGQAAESLRVCDGRGTELLWGLLGPDGESLTRGPIPAQATLIIPAQCEAGQSAACHVYFDNLLAGEVPDFLTAHLGVANGDVEKGEGDVPAGWVHDAPDESHKASWSSEEPQSGKRCLKTVVAAGAEPTWIATRQSGIHVAGGAKYRMTAWVRAENVKGSAGWYLHVGNSSNSMIIAPMLGGGAGTYAWKEVSAEFTAPPEADVASLGTVLRGTGVAWFDNVRLKCLEPSRLRAVAGKRETVKLTELGNEQAWPAPADAGAWDRRVRVRVFNFGAEEASKSLVCVDGAIFAARLRSPLCDDAVRVFDQGKAVSYHTLGNLVLFAGGVPGNSVQTYHVYYRGDASPSVPAAPSKAFLLQGAYNLVKDPGFEEGGSQPGGWTNDHQPSAQHGITFGFDDPQRPGFGRRCAKMHVPSTAPQGWRGWRQGVPVKPGHTYLLSAWIKCKDIEGGEVRVHAHAHTAEGKLSQHNAMMSVGPGIRGTTDWTLVSGLLTMPSDAAALQIHLTMQERGTVWHDNVVVAEVVRGELSGLEGRPLASSDGVKVWPVPAVVKVFWDDPAPAKAAPARVTCARNEQEPFQLAVRSGRAVRGVRVEAGPFQGPGGAMLQDVEVGMVGFVPIDYPTNYYQSKSDPWCRKFPTQPPGCDGWAGPWPDPLLPQGPKDTFDLAANATQPIWITVSVPKDATPGDYAGKVRLVAEGSEVAQVPLALHVWGFTLPERSHVGAIYDVRFTDGGKSWGKSSEEARWDVIRFMARRRLCPDQVPVSPTIRYEKGRVIADFAAFDRAAEIYFNELKLPFSYTPWEFYLFGWGFPPRERFGEHPYPGKPPYEGADRSKLRPEYKRAYQACLKAFWDHVAEKGWQDKFVLYISDEPFDSQAPILAQMKALCAMIHEVDPKIPIYSSTWRHVPEWDGSITLWGFGHYGIVPPEVMARRRAAGDRIWFTTDGQMCLDTPLCAVERLLPHYCFKYDVQAYEFWGISWTTYDPFRFGWHRFIHQSDQPGKSYYVRYPNGDGYLLYPGPLAGRPGPVSSVRLEQAREGVEDYEYLVLLKSLIAKAKAAGKDTAQAEQAMAEAAALVTIPNAGGRYSSKILGNPEAVYAARESLAKAIETISRKVLK